MFFTTVFVYPVLLGLLCAGTGLLVDRISGSFLPGALLVTVGAAGLIAASQLTTYITPLASATPYVMLALALAGFALGRRRLAMLARGRSLLAPLGLAALAYVIALAPVIAAGRPTLSSYMALTDSAVHMLGAYYLLHHGQQFAHLDLHNSYGVYLNAYYNHNYPSGADTFFGGSAMLLSLSLFFAYQPFNAFMLATLSGPVWLLVRRIGLSGALAALATLTITLPALVYGYELVGAIKEIVTLPLLVSLGALLVIHDRWLRAGPRAGIPAAVLVAGGVSAIGIAFGAWALAIGLIVVVLAAREVRAGRQRAWPLSAMGATAMGALLVCAWPTWVKLPGSIETAQAIASTANPGNLHRPLRVAQALGTWLGGSYVVEPSGFALYMTYVVVALAVIALVIGAWRLASRERVLFAWILLMLAVWLVLTESASTWADAKTLMLTSPVVLLVSWAGVAAVRASRARAAAFALALALTAGVLVSDAIQYHASNLAPTARYDELASLDARYAGRGPTLFTDYDEYALYDLHDLDVGGPNFIYPPPALAGIVRRNGYPVDLDRIPPARLAAYPLIIGRRDPAASRPPSAYRLLWRGTYYEVWGRRAGAAQAIVHFGLSGGTPVSCANVQSVERAGIAWLHAQHSARERRAARGRQPARARARVSGSRSPQRQLDGGPRGPPDERRGSAHDALCAPARGHVEAVAGRPAHAARHGRRRRTPRRDGLRPGRRHVRHAAGDDPDRAAPTRGRAHAHGGPRQRWAAPRGRRMGGSALDLPHAGRRGLGSDAARSECPRLALALRAAAAVGRSARGLALHGQLALERALEQVALARGRPQGHRGEALAHEPQLHLAVRRGELSVGHRLVAGALEVLREP